MDFFIFKMQVKRILAIAIVFLACLSPSNSGFFLNLGVPFPSNNSEINITQIFPVPICPVRRKARLGIKGNAYAR